VSAGRGLDLLAAISRSAITRSSFIVARRSLSRQAQNEARTVEPAEKSPGSMRDAQPLDAMKRLRDD